MKFKYGLRWPTGFECVLVLLLVVAIGSHVRTSWQLSHATDELAEIEVFRHDRPVNAASVNALFLSAPGPDSLARDELEMKWRVSVPGDGYGIRIVDLKGTENANASETEIALAPGLSILTLTLLKDADGEPIIRWTNHGRTGQLPIRNADELLAFRSMTTYFAGLFEPEMSAPNSKFPLARIRDGARTESGSAELQLWIEPPKKA
ncbi:hypothetical protein FF011L_38660 [Roseimaritima multifibrata]|uniref:Uncharacterized protein n=1 Tax=Roseimaritima multifibrata TaxID=1930274 RepID=A0A517MJL2_9BACT|nr:hypothetical protein [Roseimaritima multifibrata]QDS95082.1 hypothetical protein FF011L_38660 [Roseimaritima multifibrata]